jgi:hypothetical protein
VVPPRRTTPVRLLAEGRAISLDLGAETAAAVFRLGDWVIAVFDRPEALDLSQLQGSAIFRSMEARQTGDATILQMRLAAPGTLRPRREGNAWVMEAFRDAVDANRALTAIAPELDQGPPVRLVLRAARPGRSVNVLDPETGSPLLVGTLREAGQAVAIGRRQPEFQLLPAMLGVAVLPKGDNIQLRALNDRFILQASGMDSLRLGADAGREPLAEAATLSRIMDLPSANASTLLERLRTASANITEAGPLGRSEARRHAAEDAERRRRGEPLAPPYPLPANSIPPYPWLLAALYTHHSHTRYPYVAMISVREPSSRSPTDYIILCDPNNVVFPLFLELLSFLKLHPLLLSVLSRLL